jgi:cephalosporin-C deacetylase
LLPDPSPDRDLVAHSGEPDDFDEFWRRVLDANAVHRRPPVVRPIESPFPGIEIDELEFAGSAGDPVRAWLLKPAGASAPLKTVVQFTPYGSGRGLPGENLHWASAGYAHVIVDTRGQGADGATRGDTPDPHGSDPAVRGWLTRGVEHPERYFYVRVFADAAMIVDAIRGMSGIDASRVTVTGRSQGGGIAIAAAALAGADAVMPDVPLLQAFPEAIRIATRDPYAELQRYLALRPESEARVLRTLSYFDGVAFARRCTAPALFSVAMHDLTCPPSTVLAAYDAYGASEKNIETYRYNDHEGGGFGHLLKQIEWLRTSL